MRCAQWLIRRGPSRCRGAALVEALVALALLAVVASSLAPLFALAGTAAILARDQSLTTMLAASRLQELHALTWAYRVSEEGAAIALSDTSTDLSVVPPTNAGHGLRGSPPDTLWRNVSGYAEFLDGRGRHLGAGPDPPPAARYVRRWAVTPLPGDPGETLVLTVMAATMVAERRGARSGAERRPGDCWLVSAVTRTRS